jgi:hypothetical protein
MQYARGVTGVTIGRLLVLLAACSGKSEKLSAHEDAPRANVAVIVDAPPPFAVDTKTVDNIVIVHPHGANCPALEWRKQPRTALVKRCQDTQQTFADQIPALRDMATYMRGLDRSFDDARVIGGVDYYGWPELGRRYIAYAKDHPYDPKKGLNAYVIEAGQKGEMFPEYAAIFQRRPKLISAEKCTSGRASRKDDVGEFLRIEGVKGNAEIPLGCAMGFIELER